MNQSSVVLLARVDDPEAKVTRGTYSVIVTVDHDDYLAVDDPGAVVDLALEAAPAIEKWSRY